MCCDFLHAESAEICEARSDVKIATGRLQRFLRILREIISAQYYTVRMSFDFSSVKSSIFLMYLSVSF